MKVAVVGVVQPRARPFLQAALEERGHKLTNFKNNADIALFTVCKPDILEIIEDVKPYHPDMKIIGLRINTSDSAHQKWAATLIAKGYPVIDVLDWDSYPAKAEEVADKLVQILQEQKENERSPSAS